MIEEQTEKASADNNFYDMVNWSLIGYNKISKEDFVKIKSKNKKTYSTLLGEESALQFYMFRPLFWPEYRDIKTKGLDKYATQEYILNSCVLWPKFDPMTYNSLESGIVLTLVYQILATSFFLGSPEKALEMIIEV